MSNTSVNWADLMKASGGSFEPLPNGDYTVKVAKAEPATTTTDKLMYKMTLSVITGPHANRKLWANQTLSPENPNALAMFFNAMGAMGLDASFFNTNPSPDAVAAALEGKTVTVSVTTKEYPKNSGQMRNEVKTFKKAVQPPFGGGGAGAAPTIAAPAQQQSQANIPQPTSDPGASSSAGGPPELPF